MFRLKVTRKKKKNVKKIIFFIFDCTIKNDKENQI